MSRKAFNGDEVAALLRIIEKYKLIIECKKSDAITTKSKDQAWEKFSQKFSAVTGTSRTAKDLKKKYGNVKYAAKSKAATVRQNVYATGGGASTAVELNSVDEKMLELLNEKEVNGINTIYDKDVIIETTNNDGEKINDEIKEFGPTKLRQKKSAPLAARSQIKNKKESAWSELAATKKLWKEEHIKAQLKFAEAEDKRREEIFQMQKEALQKDEERKVKLHELQKSLLSMWINKK